ncbi:MAG: hypothetical protein M3411_01620, partial [Chloroflexota bacterium]|nr:hypothetical protein [Chloroflexota bacterium]
FGWLASGQTGEGHGAMADRDTNERELTANPLPRRRGLHGIAASLLGGLGITAGATGAAAQQNDVEGIIEAAMQKAARLRDDAERAAGRDERPQRNNERDNERDADDGDRGGRNGRAAERDSDNDEPRRRSSEQESNDDGDDAPRRRDARQEPEETGDSNSTTDAGSDTNGGGGGGANDGGDADADADGDSIAMGDINVDDDFDVQQVISNLNLSEFGADDGDGDVIATTGPDGAVAISGDSIARSGPGGSFAQSGDSIASSGPDGATAISGGGGDADADGGDNNDFAS